MHVTFHFIYGLVHFYHYKKIEDNYSKRNEIKRKKQLKNWIYFKNIYIIKKLKIFSFVKSLYLINVNSNKCSYLINIDLIVKFQNLLPFMLLKMSINLKSIISGI